MYTIVLPHKPIINHNFYATQIIFQFKNNILNYMLSIKFKKSSLNLVEFDEEQVSKNVVMFGCGVKEVSY